jgi:hypothetical protein
VPESTLRGVGQNASGPLVATQKIHAWITDHPGATKDELIKIAIDQLWVDTGYARRWYSALLNRNRQHQRKLSLREPVRRDSLETPASVDEVKAQAAVVKRLLTQMIASASIALEDGGYRALRPIKGTHGMTKEQMVTDPDEVRADILEREVLRGIRLFGLDQLEAPYGRVPKDLRLLIAKWARAKLITRP